MVFPAAQLHSAGPSDCLQKGGIGLAVILKKIALLPTATSFTSFSFSNIFVWGGKILWANSLNPTKTMVTFPGKTPIPLAAFERKCRAKRHVCFRITIEVLELQ